MTEEVEVERIQGDARRARPRRIPMTVVRQGVSMGMALAMICSWAVKPSVGWAIVHGVLSWFYVIYYIMVY
jgi:hypothetical protein